LRSLIEGSFAFDVLGIGQQDRALCEPNLPPGQPDQFALSHCGRECQANEWAQPSTFRLIARVQQRLLLAVPQPALASSRDRGFLDSSYRVGEGF
jgi:hypothetical protein